MDLYSGVISPNGKRVRICATELGVAFEPRLLDFQKGENRSAEYLALNPMGKVPTLVDGDLVLWESAAILWHLAHTGQTGGGGLWPREPLAQADTMRWLFFCSCHVDPYFTTLVVERFIKARRGEAADEAAVAGAEKWLARFVPVLEQQLATREYVTGRFGIADIALGCTLELSPLVRFDLAPYPGVRRWLERLHARPSWGGPSPTTLLAAHP
ncbi:MAG TPA: glutathione S-transferase family protein [Polyangiaceae bacterium]|jgi:glutathione S-transferase